MPYVTTSQGVQYWTGPHLAHDEILTRKFVSDNKRVAMLPTGAIDDTLDRRDVTNGNLTIGVSGRLTILGVVLIPVGITVTSITVLSGTTLMVTPANQFFTLTRVSDKAILGVTADDTTTAWTIHTPKTLALASTYTPTTNTLAHIGLVITAATMPTVGGVIAPSSTVPSLPPVLNGLGSTGLTDPASFLAAGVGALSVAANLGYAYIS